MPISTKQRLDDLQTKLKDGDKDVVSAERQRFSTKKLVQRFDALTGGWFRSWDAHLTSLKASKQMLNPEQQQQFELLLKAFKVSATNLRDFIHACRVEIGKNAAPKT